MGVKEMSEIKEALDNQYRICNLQFKRIEDNLKYIRETVDEHKRISNERQPKFDMLRTDMVVVKTNLTNHLMHHTEIKKEFEWKTGLIIGIITFSVSLIITVVFLSC